MLLPLVWSQWHKILPKSVLKKVDKKRVYMLFWRSKVCEIDLKKVISRETSGRGAKVIAGIVKRNASQTVQEPQHNHNVKFNLQPWYIKTLVLQPNCLRSNVKYTTETKSNILYNNLNWLPQSLSNYKSHSIIVSFIFQ